MNYQFFQPIPEEPEVEINPDQDQGFTFSDFLVIVRDILILINACFHSVFLDALINIFPRPYMAHGNFM